MCRSISREVCCRADAWNYISLEANDSSVHKTLQRPTDGSHGHIYTTTSAVATAAQEESRCLHMRPSASAKAAGPELRSPAEQFNQSRAARAAEASGCAAQLSARSEGDVALVSLAFVSGLLCDVCCGCKQKLPVIIMSDHTGGSCLTPRASLLFLFPFPMTGPTLGRRL